MKSFIVSAIACASLGFCCFAEASNFYVRVDSPFATGGPYAVVDSGPDEAEASNTLSGNHIWQAYGYSGPGVLKGMTDAWSNGDFSSSPLDARSDSRMMLDDVIFSSPNSTPISVTLNLHLAGEFIHSGTNSFGETTINYVLVGVEFGGALNNGEYQIAESYSGGLTETSSGMLTGLSGDIISETIQVTRTVPVNTPVGLNLTLWTHAYASQWTCRAISDFSNSLNFVKGTNVFDVPPGVTVNSLSGGIVNNEYVVPEPSSLALVGLAILVLVRRRRSV